MSVSVASQSAIYKSSPHPFSCLSPSELDKNGITYFHKMTYDTSQPHPLISAGAARAILPIILNATGDCDWKEEFFRNLLNSPVAGCCSSLLMNAGTSVFRDSPAF
jgi:hypothetical protein